MARSIDTVAHNVKVTAANVGGTTAAVVGMKAAVLAAEAEAADHVVANVNKGFYSLIRSQISQKLAKLQSEVDSHIMKLNQLQRQLQGIQARMGRDYNMISARYTKLFTGLNKNLEQRVYELDRPVVNFAVRDIEQVSNRTRHLTATVPVSQLESISESQRIGVSNVKYDAMKALGSIEAFLRSMLELRLVTDRILLPERCQEEVRQVAVPVVVMESNFGPTASIDRQVYVTPAGIDQRSQNEIKGAIFNCTDDLPWHAAGTDQRVMSEFVREVDAAPVSDRVKRMATALFQNSNFETLD